MASKNVLTLHSFWLVVLYVFHFDVITKWRRNLKNSIEIRNLHRKLPQTNSKRVNQAER